MLHLWFPNIFEYKGGIQVYSAFLLKALQELFTEEKIDLFLKHDQKSSPDILIYKNTRLHFSGQFPLKLRTLTFAYQIMSYGILQRPNLIISSHLNFSTAGYFLQRFANINYWTVAHGIEAWNIKNHNLIKALQNADRILAVSNYTKNRLIQEQNISPQKISILPNTFDPTRFKITSKPKYLLERYNLSSEKSIVLTVARLDIKERFKGYDQVLQALPNIIKYIPNVHYLLVGKGPDKDRIINFIEENKLQNNVTLTGFVSDEELSDHYNLCDLFILPSKTEGFGIVYLEALASGKPCIAGNQDGATDALLNGELGVLIDPDNIEAIAENVVAILQKTHPNCNLYQPEILREKVIEKFGFSQFKNTLELILNTYQ
jgi:glycosyltransferase involved in cell wall biosynthesis